jgi:restriction endonuclease Mrr
VRSVVKHLSLHQAVFASKLFDDHKFQDVPASHAKEEVTRTVVEHCGGRIRGMLDSIEAGKSPLSPVAAQRSVADHPPSLASITASKVAEAIGRIGAAYLVYQQAFVDNGIDGTMLADWLGQSDEDILRVLTTDLGMSSSLHSKRVLLELKKLWPPPPA